MDTLHTVLRSINETKSAKPPGGRDHLIVFREFLRHLDRAQKRTATKMGKTAGSASRTSRPKRARKR